MTDYQSLQLDTRRGYTRWLEREDEALRKLSGFMSLADLALLLDRKTTAVRKRIRKLRAEEDAMIARRDPLLVSMVTRAVIERAKKRHQQLKRGSTFLTPHGQELVRKAMIYGRCYWSDVPFSMDINNEAEKGLWPTLDRLDNNLGYEDNNVVVATLGANLARNALPPDQVRLIAHGMAQIASLDPGRFTNKGLAYTGRIHIPRSSVPPKNSINGSERAGR